MDKKEHESVTFVGMISFAHHVLTLSNGTKMNKE